MKKVVSIALFGERYTEYAKYLPAFVRAHLNIFPDWKLIIHCDRRYDPPFIHRFYATGLVSIVTRDPAMLCTSMLWRMSPVFPGFAEDAEYVFCRDIDSLPMPRDRAAMEWFINSGATTHTIHDNEMHV